MSCPFFNLLSMSKFSCEFSFWLSFNIYRNNLEVIQLETENLIAARENYEIAMERYLPLFLPQEGQKGLHP